MATGSSGRAQQVPGAHKALDDMKYEIAGELGIPVQQGSEDYWGEIPSAACGAVGGHMVRRMINQAEQELKKQW